MTYRPSIKFAKIVAWVCFIGPLLLLAIWSQTPHWWNDFWATMAVLGGGIFMGLMGAWHDGYAMPKKDEDKERGSAIIWVLITIALFAAVTAVMSRGSRTQTSLLTDQQAKLYAMEIIQYGNEVREAVQRLRLRGCTDTQISFANNVYFFRTAPTTPQFPENHNPNAPTDGSCDVFKLAGAGLTPQQFTQATVENDLGGTIAGDSGFTLSKVEGVGTAAPELALWIEKLDAKVCDKISELLNITDAGEEAPIDDNNNWAQYNGSYDNPNFSTHGEESALLEGKKSFCSKQWSGYLGLYIQVLIAR